MLIGLFWSLRFDLKTRLILVSTKPTPHARHIVCEPQRIRIAETPSEVIPNNAEASRAGAGLDQNFAVTGIIFVAKFQRNLP